MSNRTRLQQTPRAVSDITARARGGNRSWTRRATRLINAMPPIRKAIIYGLSLKKRPQDSTGWVRFPMYHDVESRDRGGFERQLRYMKSLGEFLSVDDAVTLLERGDPIDGRYICITFDDGYKGCYQNAFPILHALGVPAVFFVVPQFIEPSASSQSVGSVDRRILGKQYLSWDECRQIVNGGMAIESHSFSHARLAVLDQAGVCAELAGSKAVIESKLGRDCRHFACPWGQPNDDFQPKRDPVIAMSVGYRSFFTTLRGKAVPGHSPFYLPREKVEPDWGNYHIRYFFSL